MEEFEEFKEFIRMKFGDIYELAVAEIARAKQGLSDSFAIEWVAESIIEEAEAFIFVSVVRQYLTLPVVLADTASARLHNLGLQRSVKGIDGRPELVVADGEERQKFFSLDTDTVGALRDLDKNLLYLIESLGRRSGPAPDVAGDPTPKAPITGAERPRKKRVRRAQDFDQFLDEERQLFDSLKNESGAGHTP